MARFLLSSILLLLSFSTVNAQQTYKLTDLFIQAIEGDSALSIGYSDTVSTEGLDFFMDLDLYNYLEQKSFPKDSSGRIIINNSISLGDNLKDENDLMLQIRNFKFKKPVMINFENLALIFVWIENCVFEQGVFLYTNKCEGCRVQISNSILHGDAIINSPDIGLFSNTFKERVSPRIRDVNILKRRMSLEQWMLDSMAFQTQYWDRNVLKYDKVVEISGSEIITFSENLFQNSFSKLKFSGKLNELYLGSNEILGILDLSNLLISERVFMINNRLDGYLDISETVFPEVFRKIRWNKLSTFKLAASANVELPFVGNFPHSLSDRFIKKIEGDTIYFNNSIYYLGITQSEVKDDLIYDLKASYQKLGEIYKENADQQSANWAYASMMDLEGKRLREVYKADKNFTTFFRWQLNNLMKVYTNHGTDPALAITISMYVIIFFAFIYFFFPSEWDVTSKSKLLSNFKDLKEKNNKGYIMPFFSLLIGLIISLINALTLSLNAFTTLGFGNIPTKGFARYLTIIQGFVGWFLLGLFSVSLINQVLA